MGITINTQRAHKHRTLGDVTLVFTWVNHERAMVLLPTHRPGAPWYIVMDSAAHLYDDPAYLARAAAKAAEVLGMQGSEIKLATLMHDHLDDLLTMPSEPPAIQSGKVLGEAKIMRDGKIVGGDEIRADVTEGLHYA